MSDMPDEILTTAMAAEVLHCSKQRLEIWRSEGKGPKYSRLGKLIRYRRSDLLEWMAQNSVTPTPKVKEKPHADP